MTTANISDLILQDAFELGFQPKWTFGKNTCNTYEVYPETVLMPDGRRVSSLSMLEIIAGSTALTSLFSAWFLEKGIQTAAQMMNEVGAHLTVSMNLLPGYAAQNDFVDTVLFILGKYNFPAERLQFELSEAQDLSPEGAANLNRLHDEYGVSLWLGNFGTGFSNVDLLLEVHFDGLELDRSYASLVPDHDQACRVVTAITHMADTLDIKVCAKGIENYDQFEYFEQIGCFKGQGYMIGKPMNLADMEAYLKEYAVKFDRN
ncbi:MAG: EAL domain-containing protein [Clostridia bacterium]|nr:EAL domain-containing protein [Clostridia bacterium]